MKVAILGAMDQEIALLTQRIETLTTDTLQHLTVYRGMVGEIEVFIVKCGIGKVASAVATTLLIQQYQPDYVVNTGSAGGFDPRLSVGDIVIASGVKHHDVDITHFGYELGQVAGNFPTVFDCDQRLIDAAQKAMQTLPTLKSIEGLIYSGDAFIGDDNTVMQLKQHFPDMSAVEMEGAAIGQTCHLLNTPFIVLRSLSDIAGKSSTVSFEKYIETAGQHSAALVLEMLKTLESTTN